MIVNPRGEVLLGKRKVYPQPDWWIIGGRMRPGETVQTSIKRLLSRELKFQLTDLSRVRTVAYYTYCFAMRNEPRQENGNADLAAVLTITLTPEEFAALTYYDTEEYSSICWVTPQDILNDSFGTTTTPDSQPVCFHEALKRAARDLMAMQVWDAIEKVHSSEGHDNLSQLLSKFMLLKSNKPVN